jgi:hypothetical protein
MCNTETQEKINEIDKDIEKQSEIVTNISKRVEKTSSVKLGMNDEWRIFEKTANLKKFVDEEIVLLNMRLKRMEILVGKN